MFGVDPNAPPPAPRQFRLWVIGLQAVCFGLALGVDFALAEIERPWGISEYVNRWAPPPNGTIQFRHVRLLPRGTYRHPCRSILALPDPGLSVDPWCLTPISA